MLAPDNDQRAPAPANTKAAASAAPTGPKRLIGSMSSVERKRYPMATGLLDYFPDALAAIANVSYLGNEKHNPGQPLHWSRGKSSDHADCAVRHLSERGYLDVGGAEFMAQAAWRVLAELQEYLEKKYNLGLPPGATAAGVELPPR